MDTQLVVMTYMVGYKSLAETVVNVEYEIKEVENDFLPDLLGDTRPEVVLHKLEVEGIETLVAEFEHALRHIESLVKQYLINGDQPYLTGQVVYLNSLNNKAFSDFRRWQARRKA